MKLSILLMIWLYLSFLLAMMAVEAQTDSLDDIDDSDASTDGDDTDIDDTNETDGDDSGTVTLSGNSAYYNQDPAGYYYPPSQPEYNTNYGWKKPSWSGGWKKKSSSSSSSSWRKPSKSSGWKKPPQPKCPFGLAQIWFGSPSNLPYGYQMCDGTNGTPDLRDRLVIGAGTQFPFSTAGGASSITLTVGQLAPHRHGAGSLMAGADGQHSHQVTTKIEGGEHEHHKVWLKAEPAGAHAHELDLDTEVGGEHDHTFDFYESIDYDTVGGPHFDIPMDAVDRTQSYPKTVSRHPGHLHHIDGMTEQVPDHEHTISGKIGEDGDHCHYLDTPTTEDGVHTHPIEGYTEYEGDGDEINIMNPYHALYFICCGKKDYPPPSWKNSKYY
mmetsp:Transcript_1957/g.3154  ORF Transcript_1957/g.3154 Transcript_1957/m.3154 type:complete len:383 (+) Transcript_1957:140-1288(+)